MLKRGIGQLFSETPETDTIEYDLLLAPVWMRQIIKKGNKAMSKWIDFSLDERKAMIQGVVEARQIDEAAAEKDWWVTAVLYALFHTSVSEYLLFQRWYKPE
jgi:hypothetical protein